MTILAGAWAGAHALTTSASAPMPRVTYIIGLGTSQRPQVVIAGIDGKSPVTLGPASAGALLSPDGTQVAAIDIDNSQSPKSSTLSLWPAGGGDARTLQKSAQFMQLLAWSPDSTLLLVATGGGQLMVINAASGVSTTVATGVFYRASFEPGGSDQIVYAKTIKSAVNLYVTSSIGTPTRQLTRDGHSEYPVWGPNGIVYSRVTQRAKTQKGQKTPGVEYQLWLIKPGGGSPRQLTNVPVGPSVWGLTPIALSANGKHLLANLLGPNNRTEAYVVDLSSPKTAPRDLTGEASGTVGDAISARGDLILLTKGTLQNPTASSVETVKWGGGKPTVLAEHGAYASWDR